MKKTLLFCLLSLLSLTQSGSATEPNEHPLRAAILDLQEKHGNAYPDAGKFLAELDRLEKANDATALTALQRKALLANPALRERKILFVTRDQYHSHYHAIDTLFNADEFNPQQGRPHKNSFTPGSKLKVYDVATGQVTTLLDAPQGGIRDPDVSFDAKKVLLSIRQNRDDDYKIYELTLAKVLPENTSIVASENPALQQLTFAKNVADFDPIYLPDGTAVFASTREPKYNQCSRDIGANLYRMNGDGSNIYQITRNNLFDHQPEVMPDGRILYHRWEYVDRNFGDAHGAWTVNPDGTNQSLYWGNNTAVPAAVYNPHLMPGTSKMLCIFGPHHHREFGALALVDRARGIEGRAGVLRTWPAKFADRITEKGFACDILPRGGEKYEDPWPISDTTFLVSRPKKWKEGANAIFLLDLFGNQLLVYEDGKTPMNNCFDAMPIAPRPRPRIVPQRRDFSSRFGTLHVQNVYEGKEMQGVQPGEIKLLRVVEVPEKRHFSAGSWNGQGYTAPAMNWHSLECKRILGTVPVESDGSAHFRVPAGKFIYFQVLDGEGRMLQSMRSGTVVQPGEKTGCVGCHEDRLDTTLPKTPVSLAMKKPPADLQPWYGKPRNFSYLQEVQPTFDKYCVECHDYNKPAGKKLNLAGDQDLVFNTSYVDLWQKKIIRCPGAGLAQVMPAMSWGSRVSKLTQEIFAPTVEAHKTKRKELPREARDRIATWVDLNGVYYPFYASAYPDSLTGRTPLPNKEFQELVTLSGAELGYMRRHNRYPRGAQVSFARPELSPILAKSSNKARSLELIRGGAEQLKVLPRADMPGFKPCEKDLEREAKYALRLREEQRFREAIRKGEKAYDPF